MIGRRRNGHASIVESLEGHRRRVGDENATLPTPPKMPIPTTDARTRDIPRSCNTGPEIKINEITMPLVSVPQLCDSEMDVNFTKTKMTVTNATGETVLEGNRGPPRNLYMLLIDGLLGCKA